MVLLLFFWAFAFVCATLGLAHKSPMLQAIKNSTNHLKKLLADNLLKKQHKNTKVKSLTTDKCISKTKTKY
jgi:hypothetical protein